MMIALTFTMTRFACLFATAGFLLGAVPAFAASATGEVPEPSDLALFALGLLGVIMGYRAVSAQKKRDEAPKQKTEAKPLERP